MGVLWCHSFGLESTVGTAPTYESRGDMENIMHRNRFVIVPALLALLTVACEETDVVAIRVRLEDPARGTVVVHSLQAPRNQGPVESASQGVDWQQRMNLVCASGRFSDIGQLHVEDITFSGGATSKGAGYVQVSLPRGPKARWPGIVADAAPDQLQKAGRFLQPSGELKLGTALKIEIELPGAVVAQGTKPQLHKVKTATANLRHEKDRSKAKNRLATLVVPLELARQGAGDIVWHVMWQESLLSG